ncbi:hypothetical protein JD844_033864, partial [Phrynosoma platyrhinos]
FFSACPLIRFASTAGKMCTRWNYSKAAVQAPPLDYSFRGISFMQGRAEFRFHHHRRPISWSLFIKWQARKREQNGIPNRDVTKEQPTLFGAGSYSSIQTLKGFYFEGRLLTQAVWLNNNTLNDLTDFPEIMGKLLEYPEDIYWIDLSFNDLPIIDPVLTTYYNLRNLNLHGNSIQQLSEVDKLAVLPHLRSLTLHGNPIEEEKGYRSYVISTLPNLKSFDFSGVTKLDRSTANVWRRMNIKPKVVRKRRDNY